MEVFAGIGTLTAGLRASGYSTCSLDIKDWNPWKEARKGSNRPTCKGNPLDLTTSAGFAFLNLLQVKQQLMFKTSVWLFVHWSFELWWSSDQSCFCQLRLLLVAIMRGEDDLVVSLGLVCSTWVSMSRGSTHRHYFLPLGDPDAPSVAIANLLASRTALKSLWLASKHVREFKHASFHMT